jgi:hypothetical protein
MMPAAVRDRSWLKVVSLPEVAMKRAAVAPIVLILASMAHAQGPPATEYTLVTGVQRTYAAIRRNLMAAAERMPAVDFGFRPAAGSRTFGELFTHVASSQFSRCAGVRGEPNPKQGFDADGLTEKAAIIAFLQESFEYCDPAYAALTEANRDDLVRGAGWQGQNSRVERGFALADNVTHDNEMYGTVAVYLRLKGYVPPSSEGSSPPRAP